jgi:heme-degrading monooxygenase HmoA
MSLGDHVIVRICSDLVACENIPAYVADLSQRVLPLYRLADGLQSVSVLQRKLIAYGEIATVSAWDSAEAMADFFRASVPKPAGIVIRRDPLIFEVVVP